MIDIFIVLANNSSTVVEHLTIGPKIKGSNPVAAWHQNKMPDVLIIQVRYISKVVELIY